MICGAIRDERKSDRIAGGFAELFVLHVGDAVHVQVYLQLQLLRYYSSTFWCVYTSTAT
jgi:hypothetical protein